MGQRGVHGVDERGLGFGLSHLGLGRVAVGGSGSLIGGSLLGSGSWWYFLSVCWWEGCRPVDGTPSVWGGSALAGDELGPVFCDMFVGYIEKDVTRLLK